MVYFNSVPRILCQGKFILKIVHERKVAYDSTNLHFELQPNPISDFGAFIGPPVLSVSGHSDLWALCQNIPEVIFSPQASSQCQSVFLEMTQPIVTF